MADGKSQSFPVQAARASAFAPLLVIFINLTVMMLKVEPAIQRTFAVGAFSFIVFGFLAAIFALCMIPIRGMRGLLFPALLGLILNGGILYLLVVAIGERLG